MRRNGGQHPGVDPDGGGSRVGASVHRRRCCVVGGVWARPSSRRGLRIRKEVNFEYEMVGSTVQSFPGRGWGWVAHLGSVSLALRSHREEMDLGGQSLLSNLGQEERWRLSRGRRDWGAWV